MGCTLVSSNRPGGRADDDVRADIDGVFVFVQRVSDRFGLDWGFDEVVWRVIPAGGVMGRIKDEHSDWVCCQFAFGIARDVRRIRTRVMAWPVTSPRAWCACVAAGGTGHDHGGVVSTVLSCGGDGVGLAANCFCAHGV